MKVLFLITARGGSKGIPNKNIAEIAGLPLLAYKAVAAKKSNYCSRLILSTDSDIIAETARKFDIEVPFMRPDYLATDTAGSMDVILHAMNWAEKNDANKYEALCLLEPSSPFLTSEDVNNAVELYIRSNALGVLGIKESEPNTVFISEIGDDFNMSGHYEKLKMLSDMRRQALKKQYTMNGAIYIGNWEYLKQNRTFHSSRTYGYIMPAERSVEIDNFIDLQFARFLVENNYIDRSLWNM